MFWAISLQKNRDEALLSQAIRSLYFYRSHFRKNSNPAFVPWHSQAALILYRLTGDEGISDFIFEMNDWLLPHQQWGGSVDLDHWGRFYSPHRPEYGPPHASATGVYLEGLVDALVLAREVGDTVRAAFYKQAIERGIRSLAQLQFRDDLDAYYVSQKERVIGAIRTESANNEIRIDNLQHGLMALLKYRDLDRRDRSRYSARTGCVIRNIGHNRLDGRDHGHTDRITIFSLFSCWEWSVIPAAALPPQVRRPGIMSLAASSLKQRNRNSSM